ncbi:MAG TPA: alpha/beta hydrolase fold domain-containing protein [Herpetosiphonaceae bacterium]|nr:alpha/beta hydrolase fold domain-containing protein [Herpetosiphonaceae bacterium]
MHPGGIEVVYKRVGDTPLTLHLFFPKQPPPHDRRPVIIFFHGGGFVGGHPAQFFHHCTHFASRGVVAASARYRLLNTGAGSVGDCLMDAKSVIRWIRRHADELQVDPRKLVVGGSSSGAALAAGAAMVPGSDTADDDLTLSARPHALVLFSAALFESTFVPGRFDPAFYAVNHVQANIPPMLILHGADDSHFPLPQMEQFRAAMVAAGNQCELNVYPGEHGFANYDRDDHRPYYATLGDVEHFLAKLGLLAS